jgi:hypothetical protein
MIGIGNIVIPRSEATRNPYSQNDFILRLYWLLAR